MTPMLDFLATGLLDLPWWGVVLSALGMVFVTTLATTLYLHRDQTHRALDLHPSVQHVFRFWLWLSTGINTREWVAIHRKHHARCETVDDPHSPQIHGLKKVLLEGAELYRAEGKNPETIEKFGRGAPADWMERNVYSAHPWLGIVLMVLIDIALFGAIGITVLAVQMAAMPVMSAGVINGIGHYWGYRNFECKDAATNIMPIGFWFGGEELHNNHHAYPSSAKFALRRGEFDVGWMMIRLFQAFGLAKVRRVAPVPAHVEREHLDLDGVRAIIVSRLHVLRDYTRTVTLPTLAAEWHEVGEKSGRVLRRAKAVLTRERMLLDEHAHAQLDDILSRSEMLQTVYAYRERLTRLWESSAASNEKLVADFRAWIHEAEQSGIESLEAFARRLRGYQLAPAHAR
jgi:stearoyl-CoA desaturase (Delta-9 desaturase)